MRIYNHRDHKKFLPVFLTFMKLFFGRWGELGIRNYFMTQKSSVILFTFVSTRNDFPILPHRHQNVSYLVFYNENEKKYFSNSRPRTERRREWKTVA